MIKDLCKHGQAKLVGCDQCVLEEMEDSAIVALAKSQDWYWGEADFGHGIREGWCKGPFAQSGFAADVKELRSKLFLT